MNTPTVMYAVMMLCGEAVLRAATVRPFLSIGAALAAFLSVGWASLAAAVHGILPKNAIRRIFAGLVLFLAAFLAGLQVVYYSYFSTYCSLFSLGKAGMVLSFAKDIWREMMQCALPLLILLGVFLLCILFLYPRIEKYAEVSAKLRRRLGNLLVALAICAVLLSAGGRGMGSPYHTLFSVNSMEDSVEDFGGGTAMVLDGLRLAVGFHPAMQAAEEGEGEEEAAVSYSPNVMNIDFTSLAAAETNSRVKALHEYFAAVSPTRQNEKTGLFAGKNLVFICAESFCSFAIDPVHTPTLYKLQTEGFTFTNFYNPLWGVSTIDGEYAGTQSLIPKSGVWSQLESSHNWLPFTMGNQFRKLGYGTRAYHNHYAEYYGRTSSHPNLGYVYKGLGTGLKVKEMWPESDLEMMELSVPEFAGEEHFHTYYMTVSGHKNYDFGGQNMCNKHKAEVQDIELSEPCKAYVACQMELDLAMASLLEQLEAAGQLENTVICLFGDHYPYGLENSQISEFLGHEVDPAFELYKSSLILYNAGTPAETVDKICSSLDILPTLSNLFGLEYDSRLLMGRDIFSDATPLVIFKNGSWITGRGRFDAASGTFTPAEEGNVSETYVDIINKQVRSKTEASAEILDLDYYSKVIAPW